MDIWTILANIASIGGAACVIIAYYLISNDKLTNKDPRYQWLNLSGALLITASLYHYWNVGTFIIEMVWISISVQALWRMKKAAK